VEDGYAWQNVYRGSYYATTTASLWIKSVEKATLDIESDKTYSGGLAIYNVGIGKVIPFATVKVDPPARLSDAQIVQSLQGWIASGNVAKLGTQGAYNIFLPPGTMLPSPVTFHVVPSATITTRLTGLTVLFTP
jgi:hypothetical protein